MRAVAVCKPLSGSLWLAVEESAVMVREDVERSAEGIELRRNPFREEMQSFWQP